MDILKPKNDLFEQKLSDFFLQLSTPPHICEEISTTTDLHDVDNMLFIFKLFVQSYNIRVSHFLKDLVLLNDLLVRVLVAHERLVDGLQSQES